jgi:transcriptional regulator with XRE-family HTH domain
MVKETLTEKTENSLSVKVAELNSDQFPDRLMEVMGSESQRSFAKNIDVSEGTLRAWLSGKSEPGMQNLISIAKYKNASIDWLALGQGEKFKPVKPDYLKSAAEIGREQADKYGITKTLSEQAGHAIRRKDINHGEPPEYAVKRAQTTKEPPLDLQLLQEVIEALEAHLMIRGMMLTPARKALFIQLIYEHQMDKRLNKDETTERFLKLLDE